MPFLLAEILNFQGSTHRIGVGSFSDLLLTEPEKNVASLIEIKSKYKNIEWEEPKELNEDDMIGKIFEKFASQTYILPLHLFNEVDKLGPATVDMKYKRNELWMNTIFKLLDEGKLIEEFVNSNEYYRLAVDENEANEHVLKKALINENYDRYAEMVLEKVEYKKPYERDEYRKLIEDVFGEEVDFSIPYAYEAFKNAIRKYLEANEVCLEKDNTIIFLEEEDMIEEKEKMQEIEEESLREQIIEYLSRNSGDFSANQLRDAIFPDYSIQKIFSLCNTLVEEGRVEQANGENRYYIS